MSMTRAEFRRMVDAVDRTTGAAFLATVVDVAGSAYRRPGARMLILPGDQSIGSISGGCLERDLRRAAPELTRDGPAVVAFDTRDETPTLHRRYNLGCRGVIHVLVERVTGGDQCPMQPIRAVLDAEQPRHVATLYHAPDTNEPPGARFAAGDDIAGVPFDRVADAAVDARPHARAIGVELVDGDVSRRLLLERLEPPLALWIFGAGDDARPLCAMAAELGWDVAVVDHRPEQIARERFPDARTRACARPGAAHDFGVRPTAAIIMTHDLDHDAAILGALRGQPVDYVGLLGPKTRAARLLRLLAAADRLPDDDLLDRLHTPVGLDLGASNPAEVALAILSEIVAVRNRRDGGRLHERQAPIHEPAAHVVLDAAVLRVAATA